MAKPKKPVKAPASAPEADTPKQERPRAKVITRTEVADLDGESRDAKDPYAREPETKTQKVDGRATLQTRI